MELLLVLCLCDGVRISHRHPAYILSATQAGTVEDAFRSWSEKSYRKEGVEKTGRQEGEAGDEFDLMDEELQL